MFSLPDREAPLFRAGSLAYYFTDNINKTNRGCAVCFMSAAYLLSLNYLSSVKINGYAAFIAPLCAPEEFISASGAKVPGFFILNPLFRAILTPVGNRS